MYVTNKTLVLASASPRRRELLSLTGIAFTVLPSPAEEPAPDMGETPAAYAARMARLKAAAMATDHPEAVVLGADSIVAVGDIILGKPEDAAHARRMLTLLSGRTHQVVTGCALFGLGPDPEVFTVSTDVTMAEIPEAAIAAYVATGEPMDKAGAYAIQGGAAAFVTSICGSYTNVVGLPLAEVLARLRQAGAVATGV
ncbi:maf protein [Solidesulfovibrio carbinoliphilus subsp. oakridgensis]|uniref:dTTP/UTP pyrophosphatase n=1 Tax=Solidesulfovibrio carbinoliphilus subsp. oakridgensis TaxID=694327 RepID=G7QCK9_9BACT|nr:Maf family protein [Solidesulfovibrio carbinoliphilus]EHJ46165.1 maf protein [Solidesulfovibrio carbinoliphilus subsp. oakridgensis]